MRGASRAYQADRQRSRLVSGPASAVVGSKHRRKNIWCSREGGVLLRASALLKRPVCLRSTLCRYTAGRRDNRHPYRVKRRSSPPLQARRIECGSSHKYEHRVTVNWLFCKQFTLLGNVGEAARGRPATAATSRSLMGHLHPQLCDSLGAAAGSLPRILVGPIMSANDVTVVDI